MIIKDNTAYNTTFRGRKNTLQTHDESSSNYFKDFASIACFSQETYENDKKIDFFQTFHKIQESETKLPEKEWTILHYAGADSNQAKYWLDNINEIEAAGSMDNLNIVAQLDLKGAGCKRYYIKKDSDPDKITSPVLENLGDVNMADPKALTEFIKFGIKKYPAKHYMLIIATHGIAWKGIMPEETLLMSVPDLRRSIENAELDTNRRLNILAFDACLMGSTESAYEFRNVADFMVASEQVEAFASWPYTTILHKAFEEKNAVTPEELGSIIVNESSGVKQDMPTMGLINLSGMENVKDAADAFAKQILETDTSMKELKKIAEKTQRFFFPVKDLYHFAQQIAKSNAVKDKKLIEAAENLCKSIKQAVLKEEKSTSVPPRDLITDPDILALNEEELHALYELDNAHGLNAELNPQSRSYNNLQFAKNTQWVNAMNRINRAA